MTFITTSGNIQGSPITIDPVVAGAGQQLSSGTVGVFSQLLAHVQLGLQGEAVPQQAQDLEVFSDLLLDLNQSLPNGNKGTGEEDLTLLMEQVSANEGELISYLQELLQLSESTDEKVTDTEIYEEMYAMFQQLPLFHKLPMAGTEDSSESINEGSKDGIDPLLSKWNFLFSLIQQEGENKNQVKVDQEVNSSLEELLSKINSIWGKDESWQKFLKNQLGINLDNQAVEITVTKGTGEANPPFQTFLPTSLFVSTSKQQNVQQNTEQSFADKEGIALNGIPSPVQIETDALQMMQEVKGKEAGAELRTQEQAPVLTARFSHLLQDIKEVMKNYFQVQKQEEATQIRIKLTPEHLGNVDIRIVSIDGKISAHVIASSTLAREALEFQVHQLRTALVQQGIQVDKIEVTQQQNNSSNQLFNQDSRNSQQFMGQREQRQSSSQEFDESESEIVDFQEELHHINNINYVV
jgi:flagellar hook-length control protein FliK